MRLDEVLKPKLKFKHKRITKPLTRFIIDGYLSFYKLSLNEARHFPQSGKLYTGSTGKKYDTKVTFMEKDLNEFIDELNKIAGESDEIMDYKFPKVKSPKQFVKEFNNFVSTVEERYKQSSNDLDDYIENKTLSKAKIKFFKERNEEIENFNKLIKLASKMFSKPLDDPDNEVVFNSQGSVYNLLMKTFSLQLKSLDIPNEPILEKIEVDDISDELDEL